MIARAKYLATTPTNISTDIRRFCAEIEPNGEPVFIESNHYEAAVVGRCYANVTSFLPILRRRKAVRLDHLGIARNLHDC